MVEKIWEVKSTATRESAQDSNITQGTSMRNNCFPSNPRGENELLLQEKKKNDCFKCDKGERDKYRERMRS